MTVRWSASPPALPRFRFVPGARTAAEHVTSHNGRADVGELLLHHRRALIYLPAFHAMGPPPGLQRKYPLVQLLTANAKRLLQALVRTGDEAIQRKGYPESKL